MIRPLIKDMTRSELHAIMTGGFATIAGSVLAAYISFGVSVLYSDVNYCIDCLSSVEFPFIFKSVIVETFRILTQHQSILQLVMILNRQFYFVSHHKAIIRLRFLTLFNNLIFLTT